MVIKLKNSKVLRFIVVIILTVSIIAGIVLGKNMANSYYMGVKQQNFYATKDFEIILNDFNRAAIENFIFYKNKDEISKLSWISEDEIENILNENIFLYNNAAKDVDNQFNPEIEMAKQDNDNERLNNILKDKNRQLDEIKKEFIIDKNELKKQLIDNANRTFMGNSSAIKNLPNINYIITNNKTKEVRTNIEEDINENSINKLKEKSDFYIIVDFDEKGNLAEKVDTNLSKEELEEFNKRYYSFFQKINDNNAKAAYFVSKDYLKGDEISLRKTDFDIKKSNFKKLIIGEMVAIVLMLLCIIYLAKYKKDINSSIIERVYDKLWIEAKVILWLLWVLILYIWAFNNFSTGLYLSKVLLLTFILVTGYYIILFQYNLLTKANRKSNTLEVLKNKSLIYKIIVYIKGTFIIKSTGFKIAAFVLLTFIFIFILLTFHKIRGSGVLSVSAILYIFLYIGFTIFYIIKYSTYLNKIVIGSSTICNGDLNYVIDENGTGILKDLSHNINNIKSGLKNSLSNEMKSERMKSELITNVSHDLKTPLTSIINYVDLLKNEDLTSEERKDYIQILDRKAQRLKVLIEDLFEASKAASGELELNIEKVDIVALTKQSLVEFDEKIKESSLDFKVKAPKEKIYVMVDGKKTWRVLENQITNILKYSMKNTRVYIELEDMEDKAVLTLKNISAYEIDYSEDEILERFKRGDKSRHTEGSGLGLAISKSVMELQKGKFHINIDGDLFKVVIEFPKM